MAQSAAGKSHGNGMLQVSAAQTTGNTAKTTPSKSAAPRLKVVIRRLAPGLTESEFTILLGDEWAVGGGKVDWMVYKPGKESTDAAKPSRPSRAYLHLTHNDYLIQLSDAVRNSNFDDAANTYNSPCLLGPPTVEYAPYGRVGGGKRRVDARQGTIDQDLEFMDFLESLANPVTSKELTTDEGEKSAKGEKVTTTPLVQYLKDKKASKTKEATKSTKASRQEAKSSGGGKNSSSKESQSEEKKKGKDSKVEKATKEAVKVLNREAAKIAAAPPDKPRAAQRDRSGIAAAARILQRDLGLSPGNAHRKAKADADNAAKEEAASKASTASTSTAPTAPKGRNQPKPPAPVLLKKQQQQQQQQAEPAPPTGPAAQNQKAPAAPARRAPPVAVPSAGATRAFVKHANPSQGVTEALLKEAMEAFGATSHCEIDKRKGFAYVDFVEPEGLAKAMAANPTKIAQGTVQVLERKDAVARPAQPAAANRGHMYPRGGRGGSVRGRGRGAQRGAAAAAAAGSGAGAGAVTPPTGPAKNDGK